MAFSTATLFYLLFSRALITAAGIAGMWFGYRLFLQLRESSTSSDDGKPIIPKSSNIEASLLGARFKIQNAAPGMAFSLFGAILIVTMLIQSSPSVSIETLRKAQAGPVSAQDDGATEKIVMRGDAGKTIPGLTAQGRALEAKGDTAGAELAYKEAVTSMAEPVNDLAWIYLQSGRAKASFDLATVAVQLRSDEPRYIDTLERSRAAVGSGKH